MLKIFRRISADDALIMLILIIGAALRFYRVSDIPFTYDEFSAITRTHFSSFHELIEKGVKIDGHPAGVQVFLYYMVKLFGVSEVALKLPFIFFGLLSVLLVYLIGKSWFSATTGHVAASFVSFLQFPVMYSQIARPYASGLCFTLMMVYFWTKILFHPGRKYYWNLAAFVISGTLCAYNHHFSMLFAAIVGITGLFFCPRKTMRQYLAAGVTIVILYLPHLPILLFQLGIGGVEGWLSKPRWDFFVDYIRYIFQFSVYLYLLIIVLVSMSLYWYQDNPPVKKKFVLISLTWFLLPYLIGFFYSKYRCAVLQYSVLIFSFPFLLFVLFSLFKEIRSVHKLVLILLIATLVIPSLIFERGHYRLFYRNPYREFMKEAAHLSDSVGQAKCTIIIDAKKEINEYYLNKLESKPLVNYYKDIEEKMPVMSFLDSCRTDLLAVGSINCEIYSQVLTRFPYLIRHKPYSGGDFYVFSKVKPALVSTEYYYNAENGFEPSLPEWNMVDEKKITDSLPVKGEKSYLNNTGAEFSPGYEKALRSLIHSESDAIDVSVDLRLPEVFPGAMLVLCVTTDGKMLKWISASVTDFIKPGHQGRVYLSLRLSDVEFRHHRMIFHSYIWNPKGSKYMMDDFRVQVRRGNPFIYGLYREVEHQ